MFGDMKQLLNIKKQADRIKQELDNLEVESSEVRGIRIVMTGSQNLRSIEIDENLLERDNKQRLEADLLRSINAAIKKAQKFAAQKMKDVMPGFPGQ